MEEPKVAFCTPIGILHTVITVWVHTVGFWKLSLASVLAEFTQSDSVSRKRYKHWTIKPTLPTTEMAAYNDKVTQVAYEQIITKDRKLV